MADVKLIAIDLDGTLFKNNGEITQASIDAINYAADKGVHMVISTGRPYSGIPFARLKGTKMNYSINTNGASVYKLSPKTCIFEAPMEDSLVLPILDYLYTKRCHIAAFINGEGVSPEYCQAMVPDLILPDSIKATYNGTRLHTPDLTAYITGNHYHVQKCTLNFMRGTDGTLLDRDEIEKYLTSNPALEVVCGGYQNLEFTRRGVDKAIGLQALCDHLGIGIGEAMAIGDTANDTAIIKAAGIGVAMGNSIPEVLAAADYVTASNEDDGVAQAIYHFVR